LPFPATEPFVVKAITADPEPEYCQISSVHSINLETAIEPQMDADERRENHVLFQKTRPPFWFTPNLFQAFDLSACIGVHRRLTAFFRIKGPLLHHLLARFSRSSFSTMEKGCFLGDIRTKF
jgi:hypothetical protein